MTHIFYSPHIFVAVYRDVLMLCLVHFQCRNIVVPTRRDVNAQIRLAASILEGRSLSLRKESLVGHDRVNEKGRQGGRTDNHKDARGVPNAAIFNLIAILLIVQLVGFVHLNRRLDSVFSPGATSLFAVSTHKSSWM